MSMLFQLRRVPLDVGAVLLADPSDIVFFLSGYEPPPAKRGILARLVRGKSPDPVKREWFEPPPETVLELDKNWHVLHYIFCRTPWDGPLPAATLMCGGKELGDIDVGYGPARLLSEHEIISFDEFLATVKQSTFLDGLSVEEFRTAELYSMDIESIDDLQVYWDLVCELREFIRVARENSQNVVLHLY